MRRAFGDYEIYVFDLDGTLYDQKALRKIMAGRLIEFCLKHPLNIYELMYVYRFRKLKENWTKAAEDVTSYVNHGLDVVDMNICVHMAGGKKSVYDKIASVIRKWIYDDPLSALPKVADYELIDKMKKLMDEGKKVIIFSDYPIADKQEALGASADAVYSATDARIGELKPSPKGLRIIMNDYAAQPEHILMIGDRANKDGLAAENAGVDALILPREIAKRKVIYEEIL